MGENNKFSITMNLNVLNHLGINLYSNIPAVLSEVVANAWDADATDVNITIEEDKIIIEDNGIGMSEHDLNEKYLKVGFQKRIEDTPITPRFKREVMGRKGIGKLSLFSIARVIELHTVKGNEKNGFLIETKILEEKIKSGEGTYYPRSINKHEIKRTTPGTTIILYDLKKNTSKTVGYLKKRLARRFSVIGDKYNFNVSINGSEISPFDRGYFNKLENAWIYGEEKDEFLKLCDTNILLNIEERNIDIPNSEFKIKGWIGSVKNAGDLKEEHENLNKIIIMVRGKMAQEDILEDFLEGGLYSKYLVGEIHADFLDLDDEEDIATSSRQKIIEDDPRYLTLRDFILKELKHIQSKWSALRNENGKDEAFKAPEIKQWFSQLGNDNQKRATKLFGKINQLIVDTEQKQDLFKHSVLAFESFKYKQNLDALESVSVENIAEMSRLISEFDDIEATLYHQIVTERLRIIETLQSKVEDNALEKVLQEHIYEHLWLLDPSWDRATETPVMEQTIQKEFEKEHTAKLGDEERLARIDIKYRKTSGKHVIIELKRADRKMSEFALGEQIEKYERTLRKLLINMGKHNEAIEIICILGELPNGWDDAEKREKGVKMLENYRGRVVTYKQLINDAQKSYNHFIEKNKEAGRVTRLIESIKFIEE